MDFTLKKYFTLLLKLHKRYNAFLPFNEFIKSSLQSVLPLQANYPSTILLRHDVDLLPQNALKMAQLEESLGIKGTYYFRIVPESYNEKIMKSIADLGHEIGYHYEDIDLTIKLYDLRIKNDNDKERLIDLAYQNFCQNLAKMREVAEIRTICMHGSPRAKYDNKIIWKKYDYKTLGIVGEPYFDIDFNEFAYFTDTGRRWNGNNVSIRDKVKSRYNFNFKSTQEIIGNIDKLPSKIMFTIHPQRWNNQILPWAKELVWQNTKNIVKAALLNSSKNSNDFVKHLE